MITFASFFGILLKIFRRIKKGILKKILMLINPRIRKKMLAIGRLRKKLALINQLDILIKKGITPQMLWYLYKEAKDESVRQKAFQFFLSHPNLSFEDIYEAADSVSKDEKDLINALWQKVLGFGMLPEDLVEIIRNGPQVFQDFAKQELFSKIKEGRLKNNNAKNILANLMDQVPYLRMQTWCLYKKLKPNSAELQKRLDSKWLYSMPELTADIQETLRDILMKEKDEDKKNKKLFKKIRKIIGQIEKLT